MFLVILLAIAVFIGYGILFGVPYLPTRKIWVRDGLELAGVSKCDVVVDLGSGDGVVLKLAAQRGAKGVTGYEINPVLTLISRLRLIRYRKITKIYCCNFLQADLPADTTVVYIFGVERIMDDVLKYLKAQKSHLQCAQLKIVSFAFDIPDLNCVATKNGMNLYLI